jgi:hypothetical protein
MLVPRKAPQLSHSRRVNFRFIIGLAVFEKCAVNYNLFQNRRLAPRG